ncbi:hypothetical protein ABEB36_000325 [Hypothenemus hampei]|uniref:Uncharacterized protein n=1 Tax=Hypothenemus hampei TaxID=57062 RepID=A0ABD1FBD9_HYPHA
METINKISKKQGIIGEELDKLLANLRKTSASRKTEEYLQKNYASAHELWAQAKTNHETLTNLLNEETKNASYFTTQYFEQIRRVFNEIAAYISAPTESPHIERIPSPRIIHGDPRIKNSDDLGENHNPHERKVQQCQLREQLIRIEEFSETIDEIKSELQLMKPKSRYQWLMKEIEKQWENISQLNIAIRTNETEFQHQYFTTKIFERVRSNYRKITEKSPNP